MHTLIAYQHCVHQAMGLQNHRALCEGVLGFGRLVKMRNMTTAKSCMVQASPICSKLFFCDSTRDYLSVGTNNDGTRDFVEPESLEPACIPWAMYGIRTVAFVFEVVITAGIPTGE